MMDREILYKFFNNEASESQEKTIMDWLDNDAKASEILLAERKIFDAMLVRGNVESLAASRRTKMIQFSRAVGRNLVRYAAVIAVAAVASLLYVDSQRNKMMMAMNEITVPAGQHVDIVLSDGTKVCMNALSKMEYPAYFQGGERRVKLSGEAFFEVEHNEELPFIVETFICDVQVLGTKFNVEANEKRQMFTASLVEGRVKLSDRTNRANEIMLRPNDRAIYAGDRFVVDNIPLNEAFQWRNGLISFRNTPVGELFEEFESSFGVTINTGGRSFNDHRLTGKIRITDGVEHAMRVIQRSVPFVYERNESDNVIYIK